MGGLVKRAGQRTVSKFRLSFGCIAGSRQSESFSSTYVLSAMLVRTSERLGLGLCNRKSVDCYAEVLSRTPRPIPFALRLGQSTTAIGSA
jgi:hypothetical protein